jgi:RHS repeat-associated protein
MVENISTSTQSYNRIYNLLTDHLNSVQKIVDFSTNKIINENDYLSYGGLTPLVQLGTGQTSPSERGVVQNKKFTGHEDEQEKTGLIYMKGRYYDPELSIFLSPDPATQNINQNLKLLNNPQTLNPHTYAWNNPVNAFDPNGKLTIVVPGTWYREETWNSNNRLYLNAQATFGENPVLFNNLSQWSGGNNHNDRMLAGNNLADMINNHVFAEGEQLNIVAHSHGGNVVKIASHMLNENITIDNLITLGTPVRPDYPTNMSVVSNMVEVYSNNDFVQANGGNKYQLRALPGYVANGARSPFSLNNYSYERGPAGRFENKSNSVDVTAYTTSGNIFNNNTHTQLWSVQSIWDNVIGR